MSGVAPSHALRWSSAFWAVAFSSGGLNRGGYCHKEVTCWSCDCEPYPAEMAFKRITKGWAPLLMTATWMRLLPVALSILEARSLGFAVMTAVIAVASQEDKDARRVRLSSFCPDDRLLPISTVYRQLNY